MKITKSIIAIIITALVLCASVSILFTEKKTFLENENRVPESFPEFTFKNIASGDFMASFEEYLKDHFPLRDTFMKIKTISQTALGFKEISGVYINDGRLFQKVADPDISRLTDSSNLLISNIPEDITTIVSVIPSASKIYSEQLPKFLEVTDQAEIIKKIYEEIDADIEFDSIPALTDAKKDGNVFYYTDHHMTSYGALAFYDALCDASGIYHSDSDIFTKQILSEEFLGTLNSRVPCGTNADTLERYSYPGESFVCYTAKGARSELTESEYFAEDYLFKKDKYSYFGNNNPPLTVLINEKSVSEDEIVIVKDSFINCIAPHFTEKFRKVHIIDARYFKGKKISSYITENPNVTHLLISYGINSINDNTGISTLS